MPETYRAPWQPSRDNLAREADARRGTARERGYSPAWDRASRGFLAKNPLCLACLAEDIVSPARVTDHVIPHKGDRVRFWDRANWQPACAWHHDKIKQVLERLYAAGTIGPDELRLTSAYALGVARGMREREGGA